MQCDYLAQDPIYELLNPYISTADQDCEPKVIVFRSAEACPKFSLGTLWRFCEQFYILFGILMIALGGYLVTFGNKYQDHTLFLVGLGSVSTLAMILIFAWIFPDQEEMWVVFVVLLVSLVFGSAAGYATKKYAKYGILLLGAWLGGILGQILYSVLFRLIWEDDGTKLMTLSILIFAGLVAYLSQAYFHFSVIAGSSIIGSFLFFKVSTSI